MAEKKIENKTYRVVQILSPSRVVLNCGSENGITFSSKFRVYAYGPEIKDIDSGEVLERLYLPRGSGSVTVLQRRICTIESTKRLGASTMLSAYAFSGFDMQEPKVGPFDDIKVGDYADLIAPEKT